MHGYRLKRLWTISLGVMMLLSTAFASYAEGEDLLSGTVKTYKYSAAESTAEPKEDVTVSIYLAGDEKIDITSKGKGIYSYEVSEEKKTADGKYKYEVKSTDELLPAEGEISASGISDILIKERYEASNADFTLPDQDGASGGVISEAGTYTIEAASGKKLSKTLDGDAEDSIEVEIDENGNIEPFYVYTDDTCSKKFSKGTVEVDKEGPVINNATTEAADSKTIVKSHGIYGKTEANLSITADIRTDGAELEEVYLVGKKDGQETKYELTGQDGKYSATIGLPSGETSLEGVVLYLVARDTLGHTSEALIADSEEASTVTLESVSPAVSHTLSVQPNENGWYNKNPEITADAQDTKSGLSNITVYQDGKKIAETSIEEKEKGEVSLDVSPNVDAPSEDGSYKFTIIAEDNAGNISEEVFTLKIDTRYPAISFDGAENAGNYNKEPEITVNETERYYKEPQNIITAVIYKNDDKTPVATITTAGKSTLVIPASTFSEDAKYRIDASAVDAAGNQSKDETIFFIKDSTKPSLSMAPNSQPNANGWYKALPEISATSSDYLSGLKYFAINQDGKTLIEEDYDEAVKKMQTIAKKAKIDQASKDGSYTFKGIAKDYAGNVTEKSIKLKIDLVAPVISQRGVKSGTHYQSVPSIKITNDEKYYNAKGSYIHYTITRDKKRVASANVKQANKATLPKKYFAVDGTYNVEMYSVDAAGNRSKTLKYSFVKDATDPVLTISGASNGQFYSSPKEITVRVVERYYKTNNVKITAVRELNGNTYNVGFPWSNDGKTSSSSKRFSETGTYTITASAVDKAGNSSGTKKLTFTVDTKAPEITITGVQDGKVYVYGESVYPKVSFKDDYLDSKSVTYTKGKEVVTSPNFEQTRENDGSYTLTATARDKAGNTTTKVVNFVVNRFGSYFVYPDATKAVMGAAMQNMDQDIVIKEHNVSKLDKSDKLVYRDGKKIESDAKTSEKLGDKENVYTHTFDKSNFAEEGAYEANVVSKDTAKNEMESKDENGPIKFFVDRTAPTITLNGIDPKGNKAKSITVTANIQDTLTGVKEVHAYVGGQEVHVDMPEDGPATFTVGEGLKQSVKVTAVDGAGNTAEAKETASVSSNAASLFLNRFLWPVLAAIGSGLLGIILFLLGKKRKKKED